MLRSMKVIEIFKSIEGEGKRAGVVCTFIRLAGCNLRCSYCDTTYSYTGGTEMSIDEIVSQVDTEHVTITGGEPLLHANVYDLINALHRIGCSINIETNGSIDIKYSYVPSIFYTMDYKCPSSGETSKMCEANLMKLAEHDVLKFVVGTREDLDTMKKVLHDYHIRAQVYVSPVFGKIDPAEIVDYLIENKLYNVFLQLQYHKIIWDPEKRGV